MKTKKTLQNEISRLNQMLDRAGDHTTLCEIIVAKEALKWALDYEESPSPSSNIGADAGVAASW